MKEVVVCEVRYRLDPERLDEFEEYGRCWVRLIERHGGVHYGFFLPRAAPGDTTMSFPGMGDRVRTMKPSLCLAFPTRMPIVATASRSRSIRTAPS